MGIGAKSAKQSDNIRITRQLSMVVVINSQLATECMLLHPVYQWYKLLLLVMEYNIVNV